MTSELPKQEYRAVVYLRLPHYDGDFMREVNIYRHRIMYDEEFIKVVLMRANEKGIKLTREEVILNTVVVGHDDVRIANISFWDKDKERSIAVTRILAEQLESTDNRIVLTTDAIVQHGATMFTAINFLFVMYVTMYAFNFAFAFLGWSIVRSIFRRIS